MDNQRDVPHIQGRHGPILEKTGHIKMLCLRRGVMLGELQIPKTPEQTLEQAESSDQLGVESEKDLQPKLPGRRGRKTSPVTASSADHMYIPDDESLAP